MAAISTLSIVTAAVLSNRALKFAGRRFYSNPRK